MDLREAVREHKLKLFGLEVLLEAEGDRRTERWFVGADPPSEERAEATRRLVERGLLQAKPAPAYFELSEAGRRLLADVRKRIGAEGRLEWTRVAEVDFPLM